MKPASPLANVQCLRAVAAMMVVWVHAKEQIGWLGSMFPSSMGNHGVDLFFVVSGFIMVVATSGKDMAPATFWRKRFIRIAPLYWLSTLAVLAVGLLAPGLMKSTVIEWPHVVASFLFFPMESPGLPGYLMPLVVPGWTLNYEMAFYGLFGLALWLPQRARPYAVVAALALITAAGFAFKPGGALGFYCDAIILIFGAGVVLGELHCRQRFQPRPLLGWGLVALGFGVLAGTQGMDLHHRAIGAGIPALVIVTGTCFLSGESKAWPRWLVKLGDASYSVYLSHVFVLAAARALLARHLHGADSMLNGLLIMAAALVICAWAGWLTYRFIEVPITNGVTRFIERRWP